jgi:hypothetical protein
MFGTARMDWPPRDGILLKRPPDLKLSVVRVAARDMKSIVAFDARTGDTPMQSNPSWEPNGIDLIRTASAAAPEHSSRPSDQEGWRVPKVDIAQRAGQIRRCSVPNIHR